ncbi:hypothetical protein ANTPLA_LOCUS1751 [Anthophora plagiata]
MLENLKGEAMNVYGYRLVVTPSSDPVHGTTETNPQFLNDAGTDARHLRRVLRNLCGRLAVGQHSRIRLARRSWRAEERERNRDAGVSIEPGDGYATKLASARMARGPPLEKRRKGEQNGLDFTLEQTAQRKLRSIHSARSSYGEISSL